MSDSEEPEPNGGSGSSGEPESDEAAGSSGEPEPEPSETTGLREGSESAGGPDSAGTAGSTAVETAGERIEEARDSGFPVVRGAVYGTLGVVVTYLLHLYMTVVTMSAVTPVTYQADQVAGPPDDGEVTTNLVSEFVVAGWDYFSVFGVTLKAGTETVPLGLSITSSTFPLGGVTVPNYAAPLGVGGPFRLADLLLFVFTIGMIVVLGYSLVKQVDPDGVTGAVKAGVAVVPPYFGFAVLGGLLFRHSYGDIVLVDSLTNSVGLNRSEYLNFSGNATVSSNVLLRPDLLDAILLAGIVFPVAFAVTGALLARRTELVEAVSGTIEERL